MDTTSTTLRAKLLAPLFLLLFVFPVTVASAGSDSAGYAYLAVRTSAAP